MNREKLQELLTIHIKNKGWEEEDADVEEVMDLKRPTYAQEEDFDE